LRFGVNFLNDEDPPYVMDKDEDGTLKPRRKFKTYNEICLRTGVLPSTARTITRAFLENGCRFLRKDEYKLRGKKPLLNEIQQNDLVSDELLRKWSGLTLIQRTVEVYKVFKINISRVTLCDYYRAWGVSYRSISFSWNIYNIDDVMNKQRKFIHQLTQYQ
jgi:hypothetical protein